MFWCFYGFVGALRGVFVGVRKKGDTLCIIYRSMYEDERYVLWMDGNGSKQKQLPTHFHLHFGDYARLIT